MDPLKTLSFDLRLKLPNHALFVGASMSGKTRLVIHLLQNIDILCPVPKTILFLYDQYQDIYEEIKRNLWKKGVEMSLQEGASIKLENIEKRQHQSLVIIDDASEETASSMDIAKITTNGRHKNLSIWLIWHSLYSKHAASRLITQNISYLFFLPSVRLVSQIHTLDSQLRCKGALVSAYNLAIEDDEAEHKYLLLDLAPSTPSTFRLRARITAVLQDQPQHLFIV